MQAKYFSAVKNLTSNSGGASGDVVYTCPANHVSLIKFINVCNGATSTKKYSIQWYEVATTTYHTVFDAVSLAASSNEKVIEGACLALKAGDKIVAFEESGSDFHITLSGEEYYNIT